MEDLLKQLSKVSPPSGGRRRQQEQQRQQLMAVNDQRLDLVLLCEHNVLRHARLRGGGGDSEGADGPKAISYDLDGVGLDSGARQLLRDGIPEDIEITGLQFSPDGDALLLWGPFYLSVLAFSARRSAAPARLLDLSKSVIDDRALRVVQALWHPLSTSGCVAVLATGVKSAGLILVPAGGGDEVFHAVSFGDPSSYRQEHGSAPASFTLGSGSGWAKYSAWVLGHSGDIQLLCPVIPPDAAIHADDISHLTSIAKEELQWAQEQLLSSDLGQNFEEGEEDEEGDPDSHRHHLLTKSVASLQLRLQWLADIFDDGASDGSKNSDEDSDEDDEGFVVLRPSNARHSRQNWVQAAGASRLRAWPVTIQDKVSVCADSPGRDEAAGACSIVCMAADAGEGEAPVASGVMLARAYASGHLDLILVSGEFEPRWALSSEDAMDISDYDAAVLECLHLQESPVWAGQKLCPSLIPDPLRPWLLHVVLPRGLVIVRIEWGPYLECIAREIEEAMGAGELDISGAKQHLRDALSSRPKSCASYALCLLPDSNDVRGRGSMDGNIVVAAVIPRAPAVGHVVLVRLSSGTIELINIAVWQRQADVQTKALKRRASSSSASNLVAYLPPFDDAVAPQVQAVTEAVQQHSYSMGNEGKKPVADADENLVRSFLGEKEKLEAGAIIMLEKLAYRTERRIEVLRDIHNYQRQQIANVHRLLDEACTKQKRIAEKQARIAAAGENLAARASAVLEGAQMLHPSLTHAEKEYREDLERWRAQASRWRDVVARLQLSVDHQIATDGESGVGGRAPQLTPQQEEMVWHMLDSESARIDRNQEVAKRILAHLHRS